MTLSTILDRAAAQQVVLLSEAELALLLASTELVEQTDASITGPIRILSHDAQVFVQESTDHDEVALRAMPTVAAAQRFVAARLAAYERMWDGCGCKIDYYG